VAKILTFPERVNKANMKLMKELILNGPDKHPGANFVEQRGQAFKKALRFVNRNKVAQELKVRDVLDNCSVILFN
jgi:DNA-directed RNA polymerase III subunit RPC1